MASVTYRCHRKLANGSYEVVHSETESGVVVRPNTETVEQTLKKTLRMKNAEDTVPGFHTKIDADTLQGKTATELVAGYAKSTELESVKTSVSEGKKLIAAAVTDKGVETAADATFKTMADNIDGLDIKTSGNIDILKKIVATHDNSWTDLTATNVELSPASVYIKDGSTPVELTSAFNKEYGSGKQIYEIRYSQTPSSTMAAAFYINLASVDVLTGVPNISILENTTTHVTLNVLDTVYSVEPDGIHFYTKIELQECDRGNSKKTIVYKDSNCTEQYPIITLSLIMSGPVRTNLSIQGGTSYDFKYGN